MDAPTIPTQQPAGQWPFSNSDIDTTDKSFSAFAKSHYFAGYIGFIAGCIVAIASGALDVIYHSAWVVPLAASIIYVFLFSFTVQAKMAHDFAEHLASIMGYSFADAAPLASVAGDIFQVGHSNSITDVLSGTYQEHPVRLFEYDFVTGSGKSQQSHQYTILEIQFGHAIPAMSVTPAEGSITSFISQDKVIDSHFSLPMKISLEGDFNKYFSVHAPNGTEIEDLEVMSPEFMAFLVDHNDVYKDSGFECHDVRLYIHLPGALNSQKIKTLSSLYALADVLMPKLEKIS